MDYRLPIKITPILFSIAFLGCATKYQPLGMKGGYHDFEVQPGVHYVSFRGNAYTAREVVIEYWHQRAAEICGGNNHYEILNTQDITKSEINVRTPSGFAGGTISQQDKPAMEGYIRCK